MHFPAFACLMLVFGSPLFVTASRAGLLEEVHNSVFRSKGSFQRTQGVFVLAGTLPSFQCVSEAAALFDVRCLHQGAGFRWVLIKYYWQVPRKEVERSTKAEYVFDPTASSAKIY